MFVRRAFIRAIAVAAFCLVASAVPVHATSGSVYAVDKNNKPISGVKFHVLSSGTKKAPVVTAAPTEDDGKTTFDATNIPPGIYNVWACPDTNDLYAVPNDQSKEPPCPGAVFIGTIPITPDAPFIAVMIGDSSTTSSVTYWINGINPVTGNPNDTFVYTGAFPGYFIRPDDNNPQTYIATQIDKDGTTTVKTGVPPSQVGMVPFGDLTSDQPPAVYEPETDPSQTVEDEPRTTRGPQVVGAAGMTGAAAGTSLPRRYPGVWANAAFGSTLARLYNRLMNPWISSQGSMPFGLLAMLNPFAFRPQATSRMNPPVSYMLVATGDSSGEVFSLVVKDPLGRTSAVPITLGTSLEATGRKIAQPLPANSAKRPVNGYCLNFHRDPPPPNSLYRIAGPEEQEQYSHVRFVLAAVDEVNALGKLHPDIDMNEYLDAIRQYSVWTREEGWNQQQFTENWIDRTHKNAVYLNVKWTKQMERTLLQAAPSRWNDISQVLEIAGRAERAREQVLALAKQGGPWKQ